VELTEQRLREAALTVGSASFEALQSSPQSAAGSSVKSLQAFGLSIPSLAAHLFYPDVCRSTNDSFILREGGHLAELASSSDLEQEIPVSPTGNRRYQKT